MYLIYILRVKDQGKTKEEPRNDQRNNRSSPLGEIRTKDEPKNSQTQKSTFVKITVLFTYLIPSLTPPTDDRETTEITPTQLPAS